MAEHWTQQAHQNLLPLQKILLELWTDCQIEEHYQQLMLRHLDRITPYEAEEEMQRQIKTLRQGTHLCLKIKGRLHNRRKLLDILSEIVQQPPSRGLLQEVSEQLDLLRNQNLVVGQIVIQMYKKHAEDGQQLFETHKDILLGLNDEMYFLVNSWIKQWVAFKQGYDPFFLNHLHNMNSVKPHPAVTRIFNLTMTYTARLIKANTQLLDMVSTNSFRNSHTPSHHSRVRPRLSILPTSDIDLNKTFVNFRRRRSGHIQVPYDSPNYQTRQKSSNKESIVKPGQFRVVTHQHQITAEPFKPNQSRRKAYNAAPLSRRLLPHRSSIDDSEDESKLGENQNQRQRTTKKRGQDISSKYDQPVYYSRARRAITQPSDQQKDRDYAQQKPIKRKLAPLIQPKHKNSIEMSFNSNSSDQRVQLQAERPNFKLLPNSNMKKGSQQANHSTLVMEQTSKEDIRQTQSSDNNLKTLKLRPGKCTRQNFLIYLKSLSIGAGIKKQTVFNSKWQSAVLRGQSYLSEFVVGQKVVAVGVCVLLNEGSYMIKLWASTAECKEEHCSLLFSKYLDYIQKMSRATNIYYNGPEIENITVHKFKLKSDKLYVRQRQRAVTKKESEYRFTQIRCSNISFEQKDPDTALLYSDQIDPFQRKDVYINQKLLQMQPGQLGSSLSMCVKVSQSVRDVNALNSILEDQGFDSYEMQTENSICQIDVLRVAIQSESKGPFLAGDGFFKLKGQMVHKGEDKVVCRTKLAKFNTILYFGQGFSDIEAFLSSLRKKKTQQPEEVEYSVKMFNKQLYGKLHGLGPSILTRRGNYGNWQVSMGWQDELQGRIRHKMTNCIHFGPQSFRVGVEVEGELLYAFQVSQNDFLY